MWKNMAEPDRSQKAICRMRFACWISKAINSSSEYVIFIAPFYSTNGYANAPQCYVTRTLYLYIYMYIYIYCRSICSEDFGRLE